MNRLIYGGPKNSINPSFFEWLPCTKFVSPCRTIELAVARDWWDSKGRLRHPGRFLKSWIKREYARRKKLPRFFAGFQDWVLFRWFSVRGVRRDNRGWIDLGNNKGRRGQTVVFPMDTRIFCGPMKWTILNSFGLFLRIMRNLDVCIFCWIFIDIWTFSQPMFSVENVCCHFKDTHFWMVAHR